MTRKFITLEAHCGNDYVNAHWTWYYINKWYIALLMHLGFPVMSLSVSPPVVPTWVYGNARWQGNLPALPAGELRLFKDYLRAGGGIVYYESSYNTKDDLYPDVAHTERTFEDFINAVCKRLTVPFNPFTGIFEDALALEGQKFGIDAVHEYLGNLGDRQVKAVINAQDLVACWANYLCGAERMEYAGSCPLGPDRLNIDWLSVYTNKFGSTPFCWLAGLQCIIPFKNAPNPIVNHEHITDADQGQRNWCSKTPVENATFAVEWLLTNGDVASVRAGTFLACKDMEFFKDRSLKPIFESFNKDVDWRRFSIPTQVTPRRPLNLTESRMIDEMQGTELQLYGLWQTYMTTLFTYLQGIKNNNENVEIFSDATSKNMVQQQYHETVIALPNEKIINIAEYLANKVANWQIDGEETYGTLFLVNRPPDFVKLTYDSEDEYYTLAEAWWIMLYALYLIATNDGLTVIPDITLRPVIGPCQPDFCPPTTGTGLPNPDLPETINVWWQHDEYSAFSIKFKDVKKAVRGLFPQAKTNKLVGPTYPDDIRVDMAKVIWRWPLLDENENTVHANAAELLYVMAKMLVNWDTDKITPDPVAFLPSHVLPKMFVDYCSDGIKENPFGTDILGQATWFNIGQRWTLKPAVLKPEYR
jgi:hypothetical protein